jgi:NADH-quinone oxidoreductase subunit A
MNALWLLAQNVPHAPTGPRSSWAPVVLLILIALAFTVGNLVLSLVIGPSRTGPGKEQTYESGMVPVGDTHKRFNVRFYIVAMIFLVIDVDIVFMYPWATIFAPGLRQTSTTVTGQSIDMGAMLLIEMIIFIAILLLAYFYAWGKGVFRWD